MPHLYLSEAEAFWLYELIGEAIDRTPFDNTGIEQSKEGKEEWEMQDNLYGRLAKIAMDEWEDHRDRKCKNCSAVLTSPNPRKTTCSDACRQELYRKRRIETEAFQVSRRERIKALAEQMKSEC